MEDDQSEEYHKYSFYESNDSFDELQDTSFITSKEKLGKKKLRGMLTYDVFDELKEPKCINTKYDT